MAKQVGGELKNILSKEELEVMLSGYSDEILDGTTIDARTFLGQYGPAISEILQKRSNALVIEQKKKGDDYAASFLLKNPKAMRAPSGLIYNEVLAGIGAKPTGSSTVKVHYHGTLIDGTVFDSSVNRGEPITFPLQNVIKGWQEGVQMMSTGGKATLVIPSDLAYGDNGSPPVIPPGATLQFDVELLEVS
jgi:FKBP-type peptidyl-prolyl cis-trans isomerase FkpA/FKBP-type peptidyl-prolyl cis-trans isomerase FklB